MKPLLTKSEDQDSLQNLGRASVQIVHDLKNQLNGLKLYATFLRRRMEKSDRPSDEQETVAKLMSGLERAASDLSTLVQYGRPIELKKQPGVDLHKLLRAVLSSFADANRATGQLTGVFLLDPPSGSLLGEFDPVQLSEALKFISIGAMKIRQAVEKESTLQITMQSDESRLLAIIEWLGLNRLDHDPFSSFVGSDEIRMSLAAKIIGEHGGTAAHTANSLCVRLPLGN
ncbi:MAG TPA: hypothetical protein VJ023_02160 [Pyrinomonadaceae bacterium]|nr:hypothetical protein [Pyrinomonadaceae bacterium]